MILVTSILRRGMGSTVRLTVIKWRTRRLRIWREQACTMPSLELMAEELIRFIVGVLEMS